MPRTISGRPSGPDATALTAPASARIHVSKPSDLCQVQTATRGFCRSIGLDESAVFDAVIAVTELAHRLFIERARYGDIELSAVPGKRLALEVRAANAVVQLGRTADQQEAP